MKKTARKPKRLGEVLIGFLEGHPEIPIEGRPQKEAEKQ